MDEEQLPDQPAMRAVLPTPRGGVEERVMCSTCAKEAGAVSVKRSVPMVLDCPGCGCRLF